MGIMGLWEWTWMQEGRATALDVCLAIGLPVRFSSPFPVLLPNLHNPFNPYSPFLFSAIWAAGPAAFVVAFAAASAAS